MPLSNAAPRAILRAMMTIPLLPFIAVAGLAVAQKPFPQPPGPMLAGGHATLHAGAVTVDLLRYSGTVASLEATAAPGFDYTPGDLLRQRSADTYYHLGDLDLRVRTPGGAWQTLDTAYRRAPVRVLQDDATAFAGDVTGSVPNALGLTVLRRWAVVAGELQLSFTLANHGTAPIELGGVGIPMVFNNILIDRTLDQAYAHCSFYDPYIGNDAGYVQVSSLRGTGPVLLVAPLGHTPLEAWKPILDKRNPTTGLGEPGNDPTPRWTTFEGSFDWMVHSAAFADTDWKGVQEWNPPTSETLAPGQSRTVGVRFLVAPGLRAVDATLAASGRPVAVGVPGYILPQDMEGRLFLRYGRAVRSVASDPVGALDIHDDGTLRNGLHAYTLRGRKWGRARLDIAYDDGTLQTIGYRTIKPEVDAIADLGRFAFHDEWFTDAADPFGRAPSVISYDDSVHRQVTQEPRVWIAGLSDEAGAGAWQAAAMKEELAPDAAEVAKLEAFVDGVLWGHLQVNDGPEKYGVHKSLFFYQPGAVPFAYDPAINWKSWTSWNQKDAADVGRAYNYPHVTSAYWALYRTARNTTGMATKHDWAWYLNQAYETAMAMRTQAPYYTQFGLMDGTVFLRVLEDLRAEGWTAKADALEAWMHQREAHWSGESYPFGSEMPWDSTGQEEVYDWSRFFGDRKQAQITLNAVLAYTPSIPSWGYNGSARRYWDFVYGGKYARLERQLHHYGSGLNAIPLLTAYRDAPDDLYLLRVGYGGMMGPLTNIDQKGFASAAFHSFPDKMAFDPYSGDYGPNMFGHAVNTGVYLVHDDAMGWLGFGGNVRQHGQQISLSVLDSSRRSVFVAPVRQWLTLDAGSFQSVSFDTTSQRLVVQLAPADAHVSAARLRIAGTAGAAAYRPAQTFTSDAGALTVPLSSNPTTLLLLPQR